MGQRIYWVPHTICYFGCHHCHNNSVMGGIRASRQVIDGIIAHLPLQDSRHGLEEVLVGGGESLMRNNEMEYLIREFRARFPRGPQATVEERRAAGFVILALQTIGTPLTDATGNPNPKIIDYWLDQGVDYFQIASNDMFHERQRPDFPWEQFRANLRQYGDDHGIHFLIYGKAPQRLVPSGRALENLRELEETGASLIRDEGYCAQAWEAAANFLTGAENDHPDCSEVVIDPYGWVHPCCWHELSPGLFDLTRTDFAKGMAGLLDIPFCCALDRGDMSQFAEIAGVDQQTAHEIRDLVGDCGACRLFSIALASQPENEWIRVPALSPQESAFYAAHIGRERLDGLNLPAVGRFNSGEARLL
jgi:hypothetical protein